MKHPKNAIIIKGARENNLKNISVTIPKEVITIFTGVSGSGKSSLVFDTIAAESQRQLNETFPAFARHRLPHYGQPDADLIQQLSAAIIVDQQRLGGNARSTVGTITDIYTLLRLLYSRAGKPFAGYATAFSFNHPDGMCPTCEGLGTVAQPDVDLLLDKNRSLNTGAIRFPTFAPGGWRWKRYVHSGLFDNDKLLKNYTPEEWQLLVYQEEFRLPNPAPEWPPTSLYEGVLPRFIRSYIAKESKETKGKYKAAFDQVIGRGPCPDCHGARLRPEILACRINGYHIADCTSWQINDLADFIHTVRDPVAHTITAAITERLEHLMGIGLGYLTLSRETATLSGGESQRVKMVRHLGSSLTGMTYIFDEPSIGMHPRDVHQLNKLLRQLRDKGNTVLVVEHDPDVIAIADHIIDMGPGAGTQGGQIVYQGSLEGLRKAHTLTGTHLARKMALKSTPRKPAGNLLIENASLHNLKQVTVRIPTGVLTVVTGVAGSGKSSLINGVLPRHYPTAICIDQGAITGSRRSNPATYTGIADPLRELFAQENKVSASLFSANSKGACPTCRGLGHTYTDLAFMDPVVSICETCQGQRFTPEVLQYTLQGKNIHEILQMPVTTALDFFETPVIHDILQRLYDVGLGYLTLGQPLSTLSGGERQRIKLATELEKSGNIYVLDEPTTGLHLSDVEKLIILLNRLTDNGSTVIVIEHNLQVISQADWIIEMGPGAGRDGGQVVFEGLPAGLVKHKTAVTSTFLKKQIS
ncbi:excinuclease ABC subunit UvrA [Chitinophaga nivalis]|uniref:UvrABC system protein A n=1 Tax=Chitinophaga nivalis TaxID=2991709 RepID=A0ABT3IM58_9BACT|nr:excinuclease ABC subunit UvrA [Chitinophaga nivalis]MCW3465250.1 excinuclease ABC subunit UvrA [Chitinophaga nivalis]MCW3485058.1 excinuclease ABC subunit UvrA [Chitinophaga nivalis]